MQYLSKTSKDTIKLGEQLARLLKAKDVLGLVGTLGAGKTTFTKGIAAGLGVKNSRYVSSPSFVLIKEYKARIPLYHFDLYRIEAVREIENIGYQEYLYGEGVTVIEWAQKIKPLLPKEYLQIEFSIRDKTSRLIKFIAKGKRHKELISKLKV